MFMELTSCKKGLFARSPVVPVKPDPASPGLTSWAHEPRARRTFRRRPRLPLTVCEHCGRGPQHGSGELVDVAPDAVETAKCDAQRIGNVHVGENANLEALVRRGLLALTGGSELSAS
jgi:hypothetical protein